MQPRFDGAKIYSQVPAHGCNLEEGSISVVTEEKIGIATRLYINGKQIGSDSDYMDYYPSTEVAISDTRATFEEKGYQVQSISVEDLPRWANTQAVPTLVVRLVK